MSAKRTCGLVSRIFKGKPLDPPCEVLFLSKRGHFVLDPLIYSVIQDRYTLIL
jgi:hypothetical protein